MKSQDVEDLIANLKRVVDNWITDPSNEEIIVNTIASFLDDHRATIKPLKIDPLQKKYHWEHCKLPNLHRGRCRTVPLCNCNVCRNHTNSPMPGCLRR